MKIIERSYNTKLFRPAPMIFKNQEMDLLIITTSWGEGGMKDIINAEISKFLFAAQGDFEVTSPFEFNSSLTKDSNSLRMATLISNDMIYRSENKEDIKSCYEILVLLKNKNQLSWVQVGNPNAVLIREDLIPISFAPPAIIPKQEKSIALPNQFFGTEMHCHFQVGTIEVQDNDKLLLFSENVLAPESWTLQKEKRDLNSFVKNQIKYNSESPFWMGIVSL